MQVNGKQSNDLNVVERLEELKCQLIDMLLSNGLTLLCGHQQLDCLIIKFKK
jgi:hypothetical protein